MEKVLDAIEVSSKLCFILDFRTLMKFAIEQLSKFLECEKIMVLFFEKNVNDEKMF